MRFGADLRGGIVVSIIHIHTTEKKTTQKDGYVFLFFVLFLFVFVCLFVCFCNLIKLYGGAKVAGQAASKLLRLRN